ncbi:hypothetical protein TRICHSKD4_6069 [Roseibium sp. TrichSKD4]|nr:hypothetical protein TRICHSKD4_6069 [Roseibium sp. TrichSKD4]
MNFVSVVNQPNTPGGFSNFDSILVKVLGVAGHTNETAIRLS